MKWQLDESRKFFQRDDVEFFAKKIEEHEILEIDNKEIIKAVNKQTGKETDRFKDSDIGYGSNVGDTIETFEVVKKKGKDLYYSNDPFNSIYLAKFDMNSTTGCYSATQLNRLMHDNCESFYKLSKKARSKYNRLILLMLFFVFYIIIGFYHQAMRSTIYDLSCIAIVYFIIKFSKNNRKSFYDGNIKMKEDALKFLKEEVHEDAHSIIKNKGSDDWIYWGLSKKEIKKEKIKSGKNII